VHIVTRRHLREAMEQYPDAASEIKAWVRIVEAVRWRNFAEVRRVFTDADYRDGYVIFNFRRNRYRLITVVHYAKTRNEVETEGHVYIRSFLTHKEYENRSNRDRRFGTK
jgi:mRNA interferase HigB